MVRPNCTFHSPQFWTLGFKPLQAVSLYGCGRLWSHSDSALQPVSRNPILHSPQLQTLSFKPLHAVLLGAMGAAGVELALLCRAPLPPWHPGGERVRPRVQWATLLHGWSPYFPVDAPPISTSAPPRS
eukprot:5220763-Prymnesium_polylepis.1